MNVAGRPNAAGGVRYTGDGRPSALAGAATALCYWLLTTCLVAAAVLFGAKFLVRGVTRLGTPAGMAAPMMHYDGALYARIAAEGYDYDPDEASLVVFFPGFPLVARGLGALSSVRTEWALLAVANAALAAACVVMWRYAQTRSGGWPASLVQKGEAGDSGDDGERSATQDMPTPRQAGVTACHPDTQAGVTACHPARASEQCGTSPHWHPCMVTQTADYAVLWLCLFPTAMFFRMAYSESLFVLCVATALLGMARRWPLWAIALAAGAATGTRAAGVALLPVFALHVWRRSAGVEWRVKEKRLGVAALRLAALRLALLGPLACWGLLAYMAHQQWAFGDALAFFHNARHWRVVPAEPPADELVGLLTFKSWWTVYVPSSPAYWQTVSGDRVALFSLQFANPLFFLGAIVLLGVGAWRRWLSAEEVLLVALLLAIPYVATSQKVAFAGMGRFVGAMVPLHLVLGRATAALPGAAAAVLLVLSAGLMAAYAALFAAGYPIL